MFEALMKANCHSKSNLVKAIARELLEKLYGCEINCVEIDTSIRFAHHARGCTIAAAKICKNVVIFQNVTIGANLRFNKVERKWENVGNPIIDDNVIVGDGAKILGPITIGKSSVVAAGAIITKNIPANSIAFGANQFRAKDANYDYIFNTNMISPDEIIATNKRLIEQFEYQRSTDLTK